MDLHNYVCEQLKAEISEEEFTFLDMKMYKSTKFYPCRVNILQSYWEFSVQQFFTRVIQQLSQKALSGRSI